MASRSSTSEFQPIPRNYALRSGKGTGQVAAKVALHKNTPTRAMNPGPNTCAPPTGGTTTGKSIRPKVG